MLEKSFFKRANRMIILDDQNTNDLLRREYNLLAKELDMLEVLDIPNTALLLITELRKKHIKALMRDIDGMIFPGSEQYFKTVKEIGNG